MSLRYLNSFVVSKPPGENKWHNSQRLGQSLLLDYFQLLGVAPTVNPPVFFPVRTKAGRRYLDHLWVHDLQAPVLALQWWGGGAFVENSHFRAKSTKKITWLP